MYRVIGADGQEYGPVSAEEMRRWIAEGRANAQTRVFAGAVGQWRLLGDLPEFAATSGSQSPSPPPVPRLDANLSKCALAGFILSALGFCCCLAGLPVSIAGLILSWVGLGRIKQDTQLSGRGLAIAGIVLGILGLLVSVGLLVMLLFDFTVNYAGS